MAKLQNFVSQTYPCFNILLSAERCHQNIVTAWPLSSNCFIEELLTQDDHAFLNSEPIKQVGRHGGRRAENFISSLL